jgi:hypothetical protein
MGIVSKDETCGERVNDRTLAAVRYLADSLAPIMGELRTILAITGSVRAFPRRGGRRRLISKMFSVYRKDFSI